MPWIPGQRRTDEVAALVKERLTAQRQDSKDGGVCTRDAGQAQFRTGRQACGEAQAQAAAKGLSKSSSPMPSKHSGQTLLAHRSLASPRSKDTNG